MEKLQELIGKAKERTAKLELLDYQHWDKLISGAAKDIAIHKPGFFERLFNYKV
ncbi:hypothetical protein D3C86_1738060 [compost metagenome]